MCEMINMILVQKYLHFPRDIEEMWRKVSKFEIKFGDDPGIWLHLWYSGTYLLNDLAKTCKIIFDISSIDPSTFQLYVIVKGKQCKSIEQQFLCGLH